ncbi:MAG: sulfotransferase family protein [Chloroflexi bacterium]|nr:sulfotransferase family protein [Chloroflexota bacterium]
MKLIGAGFARTGTMSLRTALGKLGYQAYHMEEAAMNYERGDLAAWNACLEGRSDMDWHKLFAGYDATTDLPACLFYRELMEAFPEARVILTVRDPEKWWQSFEKLTHWHNTMIERLKFVPRFREFQRLFRNVERVAFGGMSERENCIARFNQHNEAVKAAIPPDRLLVFEVKEGWEPLCRFLGVPAPDEPFPHVNEGIATVDRKARSVLISDLIKTALPVVAVVLVVIIVVLYLLNQYVLR